jgi:hypothetical protein
MNEKEEVKKLAGLLLKNPADQRENLLAQAKIQVAEKEELGQIFDNQVEELKKDCPQLIIKGALYRRDEAIEKAFRIWKEKYPDKSLQELVALGIYPLIIVVPQESLGIGYQVEVMETRGIIANSEVEIPRFTNENETATWIYYRTPYVIYLVEKGEESDERELPEIEKEIRERKRKFLTVEETLALVRQTDLLSSDECRFRIFYALGSKMLIDSSEGRYPYIAMSLYERRLRFRSTCYSKYRAQGEKVLFPSCDCSGN